MKSIIVSNLVAATLVGAALTNPSVAQVQSDQQSQPGMGGTSKPGVQGLPGSKAGPTAKQDSAKPSPPPSRSQSNETTGSSEPSRAGSPVSPEPAPDSSTEAGQQAGASGKNPTMLQDESRVPGMPGSKSGPTMTPGR